MILNDSKSSTYKLALLRVIARIADSAVGLAAPGDGDRVRVPLGLVALYWIRMFKPLLQARLPQTPANQGLEGLGFVRDGFRSILQLPAQNLRIGASLSGADARALKGAVSDAAALIARMPAFYTTYTDGQRSVRARGGGDPLDDHPDDESRLLDEIYAGVEWQRMRLRHDQRLEEWPGIAAAGS